MAEADKLALFFKIIDSVDDEFSLSTFIGWLVDAITSEKALASNATVSKLVRKFEKSHAIDDGKALLIEVGKWSTNERAGICAALQAILAQLGDGPAESFCAEICLFRHVHAVGAPASESSRRLTQSLGWMSRAVGACSMTALRLHAETPNVLALLQGYDLISKIKAMSVDRSIFEQIIDRKGGDLPPVPDADRYGDGDGWIEPWTNSISPVHKLPEYLVGQTARTVYDSGYESPLLAAGIIASKVKARFPKVEAYCDQIIVAPSNSHAIWDLLDELRQSREIECGEEAEALLAVLAFLGDRRGMLESAAFAVRRAYHNGDKNLLEYALGCMAVASGAREVNAISPNENAVQSAIGLAGGHLVNALMAQSPEAVKARIKSGPQSFDAAEKAIGAERRADEAAEADADRVIDDAPISPKLAQPSPSTPLRDILMKRREADEMVRIVLEIGNLDVGSTESRAGVIKFGELKTPKKMLPMPEDLAAWRTGLVAEFPHAVSAIDAVYGDLRTRQMVGKKGVAFRPTLLVGSPGCGKSRLARRLAESLQVAFRLFPCGGVADSHFAGLSRGWSGGHPSTALDLMRAAGAPNPIIVMDEIEKVAKSHHNGNLIDGLLSQLEPETARKWTDPFVQGACDVSHVNWLMTANTLSGLPAALLDRLRIVHIDQPTVDHLPALSATILKDLSTNQGDHRWHQPLAADEIAAVAKAWQRQPSIRYLRRLIEGCLRAREQASPRH